MLQNFILSDIIQYVLNIYISHRPDDLQVLEKSINFKFLNIDKYIIYKEDYVEYYKYSSRETIIDGDIYARERFYNDDSVTYCKHLSHSILYFRNYKEDGLSKGWYNTGELAYTIMFKNGEIYGETKDYYKNGNIRLKQNYINGKKEGVELENHENGNTKKKTLYGNGEIKLMEIYDINGKMEMEFIYNKDGSIKQKIYKKIRC
jgi:antitoxin component YwqK of YwqJK toxin-antitoxin module